jgi:hypothetical protein
MIFLYRLCIQICSFFFVSLPLTVLGILILLPVVCIYDIGKLPAVLRWFDSADPYVGRDTSVITQLNQNPETSKYFFVNKILTKYNWLAFRNPINYFSYKYLGFQWDSPTLVTTSGSSKVGDSAGKVPGLYYIEVIQNDRTHYEYYFIYKLSSTRCIRARMGHKIGQFESNKKGDYVQQVLVIQPFKSYSGV